MMRTRVDYWDWVDVEEGIVPTALDWVEMIVSIVFLFM